MQDRIPLYPGRVTMTPVSGQTNTYDMKRADEPLQEGDPLNKVTLLTDAVAAKFKHTSKATPNDIFNTIHNFLLEKVEIEIVSYQGTGTYGPDNPTSVTFSAPPSVIIMLGHKSVSDGHWYQGEDLDYEYVYMLPASAVPTEYKRGCGFGNERNYYIYGKKSADGKTFSWYSWQNSMGAGSAGEQCNSSGIEYYVLGLLTNVISGNASDEGSGGSGDSSGGGDSGSGDGTITFTIDGVGTYSCAAGTTWADWEATTEGSSVIYIDHDDLVWLSSGELLLDSSGMEQDSTYPIIDGEIYYGGGATE